MPDSSVEPERGKPEMKWNFLVADTGMVTHEILKMNPDKSITRVFPTSCKDCFSGAMEKRH
jgi:hypothetical protein